MTSDVTIIESKIVIAIILNNRIESKWRCWVTLWNDYFIWRGPALQRSSAPTSTGTEGRYVCLFTQGRLWSEWERGRAVVTGARRHLIMMVIVN